MDIKAIKTTFFVRAFAFLKIPLLWWVKPTVVELSDQRVVLKIPLSRRTRNHLRSMYFGALNIGAEAAVGIKATDAIQQSGHKIDFIFKDFKASFLKRAEDDVFFICDQAPQIQALIVKCSQSQERETATFQAYAVVKPSKETQVRVAEFDITLSVKRRS